MPVPSDECAAFVSLFFLFPRRRRCRRAPWGRQKKLISLLFSCFGSSSQRFRLHPCPLESRTSNCKRTACQRKESEKGIVIETCRDLHHHHPKTKMKKKNPSFFLINFLYLLCWRTPSDPAMITTSAMSMKSPWSTMPVSDAMALAAARASLIGCWK